MITTPTILIGIANNKMNKLIYSKNEIYYYVVGEVIRKRLCSLFDALGNISSYNDYYCFTKKYSQFKQFSFCYASVLLNYKLNEKQGMVIAIDNVTHELYLPSKNEFNCISLGYHYPHLVCNAKEDNTKYKKLMKVVLAELTDKMYRSYMKKEIEKLMNQVIQEIKNINTKTSYVELESDSSEEYENDFEIDYEEQVKLLEPIEEESLDSVVEELNEIMTVTHNHLPKSKYYNPVILTKEKQEDKPIVEFLEVKDEVEQIEQVEEKPLEKSLPSIDEVEFLEVKDEVEQIEEKPLEKSLPSIVEFLQVKDEVEEVEDVQEKPLEKSLSSIVEFLEVKDEVEQIEEKPLEKSLPSIVEFLEVKDQVEQVEEKPLEKSITETIIEDIELEIVKAEENEDEEIQENKEEPLQSSTLVTELFQKFQNKVEEVKPEVNVEPKKTYNRFWSYLGWK